MWKTNFIHASPNAIQVEKSDQHLSSNFCEFRGVLTRYLDYKLLRYGMG